MKHVGSIIFTSLCAILISGSLSATAHAQYDRGVIVKVPFAFSADGQRIAAGTYELQVLTSQFFMSIRNMNTGREQFIAVLPEEGGKGASQAHLIFEMCGGHSYLTEVHIRGAEQFSETVEGRMQRAGETRPCSRQDSTTLALW